MRRASVMSVVQTDAPRPILVLLARAMTSSSVDQERMGRMGPVVVRVLMFLHLSLSGYTGGERKMDMGREGEKVETRKNRKGKEDKKGNGERRKGHTERFLNHDS